MLKIIGHRTKIPLKHQALKYRAESITYQPYSATHKAYTKQKNTKNNKKRKQITPETIIYLIDGIFTHVFLYGITIITIIAIIAL